MQAAITGRASSDDAAADTSERILDALVWIVLALLALGLPAGYFIVTYTAHGSALQTKAEVRAETISQLIGRSPGTWRFETLRMTELLVRAPSELADEWSAVRTEGGEVVAASSHVLAPPTMRRSVELFDAGLPVGYVLVERSMRELVVATGIIALGGMLLAVVVFSAMRRARLRNRRIAAAMAEQQERARVTLHSIGDAVITTDVDERVDYLNPVAEQLTQWSLAEARGRPLAQICPLIDESTMESLPSPVARALRDRQLTPFSGKEVALVRRDGSSLAVEDSAAPIHHRLGHVVGGVLVFSDVTATRRMAQRITWAATHDALTGLVNRREFESRVEAALVSARNSDRQHVVCYLDLDQFKIVNDSCGHAAGDALLKQLAGVLQAKLRESDTLARLGGDEFGVLLQGCSLERARLIAADLLAAVRDHRLMWEGRAFAVGVSIGLVAVTVDTGGRAEIFAAADAACYSAKEQGRNRVCVYLSNDADMAQRRNEMDWAARLTSAIEQDRFVLHYQPYLPLGGHSGAGRHIEILLRLQDEQGRIVPPGSFLPAAERYNVMPDIDRWVIRTVFTRHHELAASLGAPLICAINLSGTTLNSEGILEFIREQALLHRMPKGSVCFEITETAAINNMRKATEFMRAVKELGFSFALDDFGVGTSSLAYLKTLPVDYLKIDGSFIQNIAVDPIDRAMADTINRVGHIMGLQTVGECAESEAVINELRALGVDFAQGFGVQRPMPLPLRMPLSPPAATPSVSGSVSG